MSASTTRSASAFNRRSFLKTGLAGATGLIVGFYLPGPREAFAEGAVAVTGAATSVSPLTLNAWIHVGTDDIVTIVIDKSEMGQGILTSLAMLAAEELDCDWKKVRTEFALAQKVYINPAFGVQGTGGSASTRASYEPMRRAGAAARGMLVAAAAAKWGVDKSECHTQQNTVVHKPTQRTVSYGSLAADAAKLPPPDFKTVPLKDAADFKLIGKPTKRLDTPVKVDGTAEFGLDARCPGMLYAVVARCPVFGGKVASFDATKAKAVPGVKDVVQIKSGVAVVADSTWSALQGRKALDIQWDEGPAASLNSAGIFKLFADRAAQTGVAARKEGDAPAVLAAASQRIEAVYQAPYVAHCAMEPLNCTADVRADGAEIWAQTQFQTTGQAIAAQILGVKPEAVVLHTTFLGGGFGRKGNNDDLAEAVQISKAVGKPVKVVWSREDDTQHDFYRPASYCAFSSTLDADGKIKALSSSIACGSVVNSFFPGSITNGLDPQSVEGIADTEYDIPNFLVNYQLTDTAIPVGFWRSVGTSQNGFFFESYIDELAAVAKKDPYEFRRQLLAKAPRRLAVLNLAAEKAGWGTPLPPGRYRGIAVLEAFQTYVAQVAEVSVDQKARTYRVHRVVCAIDCGQVVNPATIEAQMQGSVAFAMSMMKQEITIDRGRVQQSNFNNFPALRFNEMPVVEGHIVPSTEKPTGVGEPNVPCLAPAVCNAIFAATGKRIRRLPIRPEDLA